MRTRASVFGHPLHSMLVVLPLGAFPTALVLDALHLLRGDPFWWEAARVVSVVGVAGVLVALAPGFVDYAASVPREGEARRRATRHLALGSGLVAFFALLLAMRVFVPARPWGAWVALAAGVLGVALLAVQTFLGNGLVALDRVGVEEDEASPGAP